MTLTLFISLLVVLAVAVALITQAVKTTFDEAGIQYSSNLVVLIVSLVVGIGGAVLAYMFFGIPYTPPNIACLVLMPVAVWVGAMVGYDKVLQMLEQIQHIQR